MKSLLFVFLGALLFLLGFIVGGVHRGIPNDEINFWSMIGGWVSGIGTFAAVIVSLYMAYQSMKSSEEQLHVSLNNIQKSVMLPDDYSITLMIKNIHNVKANVKDISVKFGKNKKCFTLLNLRRGGKPLPYVFERKGDAELFSFGINSSYPSWDVLEALDSKESFEQGFFIVETTMKRYQLKMTQKELHAFKTSKNNFEKIKN